MPSLAIKISGQVQEVGCRYTIKRYADNHHLVGWVKNLVDGRVAMTIASDNQSDLDNFVKWLNNESGFYLSDCQVTELTESVIYDSFKIIYK